MAQRVRRQGPRPQVRPPGQRDAAGAELMRHSLSACARHDDDSVQKSPARDPKTTLNGGRGLRVAVCWNSITATRCVEAAFVISRKSKISRTKRECWFVFA